MPSSALLARGGGGWIRETLNPAASGKILQERCKREREEKKERESAGSANYFTRARRKSKIRSESSARGRYYAAEQDEEEAVRVGRGGGRNCNSALTYRTGVEFRNEISGFHAFDLPPNLYFDFV